MARPSPVKTTMSSTTVMLAEPLDRGHVPEVHVPIRAASWPAFPGQGRVLEEYRGFMGMRSFHVEIEADADEAGGRVQVPCHGGDVLDERLGRGPVDPPPQDSRRRVE